MNLSGKPISYWLDSSNTTTFPVLNEAALVDVVVVGGGIAGLTTAWLLKQAGKSVAVLEAGRIAQGASGHTTAKVTALHQLIYADLIQELGEDKARLYAESNQAALDKIIHLIQSESIDCDFSFQDAYTFAESADQLDAIKDEVDAALKLGLAATFVQQTHLPFPIAGAIKLERQAQFHVRKYLLHLAQQVAGEGSYIFEQTRVHTASEGMLCTVKTERGKIQAQDVVITTNLPILDQGLFFAKTFPKRSYIVGAWISSERAPAGMFIGVGDDYRSIRTTPYEDGQLLLIGGEGHKVGSRSDTESAYQALEAYGRERFNIDTFDYRWSSQDVVSFDKLPYVGKLTPLSNHIYVATGFSLWGMTNSMVAAMVLTDKILGRPNPWAKLYDATRATPFLTRTSMEENLDVGRHWLGDRMKALQKSSLADVQKGEGALLTVDGKQIAVYRDHEGKLEIVSATCSHLGCIVNWNSAEKSWDCPCHGARFTTAGKIICGPAVHDLEQHPFQ
ncbi:FAD-dependent oxidoreductase [Acaryochloris sp. CCMEE 5410]|uniref:FAD-dependent oxidoreductase n=1 Tax=Acaryochloris sp. CCMEE 5410 TaxID=310037 RepID=UPI0002484CCB|nr:FAD-dependent oxidoreductase [Acaryochloris sp. CCMEE 5410]KAI9132333.1 FAD-dependent oxidoreductase [Acaryochloris sp. CCMEE 5410]